jgi:hypothetical protein
MTDQQPTRFENYPPETSAPFAGADPAPTAPPPVRYAPPPPVVQPPRTHSRRNLITGVIALAIGGPVIAAIGASAFERTDEEPSDTLTMDAEPPIDEDDDEEEPIDEPTDFTAGDYSGSIPSGWRLADDDDDSGAVLTKGANQVTVVAWAPASDNLWPLDDITEAVHRASTGFKGTLGKPVNESTGTRAQATLSGKGTFQGKPAREFAELWLDDNDSYLLIVTVLTAEEGSAIARQATDIAWNLTSGLR